MEVPWKLDLGAVSAEDSTLVCLPCDIDGLKEPAYGFCQDCQEHLCETCFKHHRRPRQMRNHVLVEKEYMPKTQVNAPTTSEDMEDFWTKHQDKPLEFYCRDHTSVACYVCVTLEHKQCNVDYIPDVSGNLSDEMADILEQMESLITKCKSNIEYACKAAQHLDQSHAKVVEDIKVFRKEINKCLDRMETRILNEADTIVKEAKCKQELILNACLEITEELECSHALLRSFKEEIKQTKRFIKIKNIRKSLPILTDKEKTVLHANTANDCVQFTRNASIIDFLKTENNYGTLSTFVQPYPERAIDLQYIDTIDMKQTSDKEKCNITGMVLIAPTKMVVADNSNKKYKTDRRSEKCNCNCGRDVFTSVGYYNSSRKKACFNFVW
ncbi:E3 ubiquitin-protein ligase TRIM71-like [Ruditapes philippinarum]|uniref:E3 ubiquitin-protein ligase TRIM71-like n=1 Tax=Ruditapes philippinarum TaxID=129788 RepID=UPI00295B8184|nr:E3 ubiquitin-protein ligase TRIM71-like [Ruditapes philippinarum]